ncbi:MAG: alpha/beta hydrolase [Rubellimicrobium sp.]|nr:alpha/beta hydrolase [Rubellimicrobium sp.]
MGDAPWSGAPGPEVIWRRADDGVRLRIALWQAGGRGTVLLFPGRTEYVEKYADVAAALTGAGFAVASIDWRGQGLSDRLASPASMGHVRRFADYQRDVAALVAAAGALPRPWHLLAHSMGGAIGLRALHRGLPVASAAFSAPMWGIAIPARKRAAAWVLSTGARLVHMGARFAPGEGPACYAATAPFEGNTLTTDRDRYLATQAELQAHPELALGGPSLGWLGAALWETRALARLPAPDLPALALLGGDEAIVEPGPIRDRMAHWPRGRLAGFPGARHELLMERAPVREAALAQVIGIFAGAAA